MNLGCLIFGHQYVIYTEDINNKIVVNIRCNKCFKLPPKKYLKELSELIRRY